MAINNTNILMTTAITVEAPLPAEGFESTEKLVVREEVTM